MGRKGPQHRGLGLGSPWVPLLFLEAFGVEELQPAFLRARDIKRT